MNRDAMPKANFEEWLSADKIAELLRMWTMGVNTPKNGAFVSLENQADTVNPVFND